MKLLTSHMRIFGIVHLVYKAPWDFPDLCTQPVALVSGPGPTAIQSRKSGVRRCCLRQSASHGLVNWHVCFSNRTPSVQYTAGPPRFVYTASGTCTGPGPGNVQSRTAGVQRCRLRQSASHHLVNWHMRFRNRTPSVQGAEGPPRFVYTVSGACTGPRSRSCTEPYSGCTKMPFVQECFPCLSELACAFPKSYT